MYRPETPIRVAWTQRHFWAGARRSVAPTVWYLGLTSLLTDISAEMVVSVLPAYFVLGLRLSPVTFGALEGVYRGATALTAWVSGYAADRWRSYKPVALVGYGLSAVCRVGLLVAGGAPWAVGAVLTADRLGKGIRTAPRDALISLSASPQHLAHAFGVHRALDATGALLGPLLAVWLLRMVPGAFDVVFVVSFAVAIIGVGVLATFVDDVAREPARAPTPVSLAAAVAALRAAHLHRLVLAAGGLGLVTITDGLVYLALQERTQLPAHVLPLLFTGTSVTFLLCAVPLGLVADRVGRVRVFVGGHLALLALYGVLLAPLHSTVAALVVVALLGFYYAATDGVLMALVSTVLPTDQRGSGLALMATVMSVARMGAAFGFGALWTAWGRDAAIGAFAVALLGALVFAARALPRSLGQEPGTR